MDKVNLSRSRKIQVQWIVTAKKFVQFAEPYEFKVERYVEGALIQVVLSYHKKKFNLMWDIYMVTHVPEDS